MLENLTKHQKKTIIRAFAMQAKNLRKQQIFWIPWIGFQNYRILEFQNSRNMQDRIQYIIRKLEKV